LLLVKVACCYRLAFIPYQPFQIILALSKVKLTDLVGFAMVAEININRLVGHQDENCKVGESGQGARCVIWWGNRLGSSSFDRPDRQGGALNWPYTANLG
jgi:hypothetical protein